MASSLPQFTVRIQPDLLAKLRRVAEYNGRSTNREVEMLIRRHVEQHESAHGSIIPKD